MIKFFKDKIQASSFTEEDTIGKIYFSTDNSIKLNEIIESDEIKFLSTGSIKYTEFIETDN